jgi:hypothetical protein
LRTASEEQILPLFAEVCAPYAEQLVVLVFESNQARSVAGAGVLSRTLSFETGLAPAIVAAIDSRDPVVALATDSEISPVLAEVFGMDTGLAPGRKVYLFPIVARHSVVAMLIASGVVVSAPIELLCEAAGMRMEAVAGKTQSVQAAKGDESPQTPVVAWDGLSADDQRLHLQAQRMARLRVAEMRLYHEDRLRSGIAAGDIYSALQSEIDPARSRFLQTFLSKSRTMVDYLHLEILRSLAHDDDRVLGHRYPGPMV